jgi:glycosyltransferase involved in cell wall biosynthesis
MSARAYVRPRLGRLHQYEGRHAPRYRNKPTAVSLRWPSFTVVTPSLNQGRFIAETLDSVLSQGCPLLEYVVQDGGSDDNTLAVLQHYSERLSRWRSEPDRGQSDAINRGFESTSGEIMAWLNSDDLFLPGALATVARYFAEHPDVEVVYGDRLLIDEEGREVGRWILPGHDGEVLKWNDYVPQETLFWRRRIWEKIGSRVDESFRFAMDWDLLIRFQAAGAHFAHIPRFLGAFRVHEAQKTSAQVDIGVAEMNRVRAQSLGRVPSRDDIRRAVFKYVVRHIAVDRAYGVTSALGLQHRLI